MNDIESAARRRNGWHVVAVARVPQSHGTVPHGVVCFWRSHCTWPDLAYGVADFAERSGGADFHFHNGSYDIARDLAFEVFTNRVIGAGGLAGVADEPHRPRIIRDSMTGEARIDR